MFLMIEQVLFTALYISSETKLLNENKELERYYMKKLGILKRIAAGIVLSTMGFSAAVQAEEASGSNVAKPSGIVVFIQPQEYKNPIKLWQYYRDYWYTQGPIVEAATRKIFETELGGVDFCDSNQTANKALVWLRPRMFYNPQVQTFYGTITAVVYNPNGKPISTYVGEANKAGFLDIYPEKQVATVYAQAIQLVADKMKADSNLQALLHDNTVSTESKTPCSLVTLLPAPKIQFMSF